MKKGFTLVELLVVIAIIGILSTFVLPNIGKAIQQAKATQVLSNGKAIVQSVIQAEATYSDYDDAWPGQDDTEDSDSSKYFNRLIENEYMDRSYKLFAAPGVPVQDAEAIELEAKNNAWCAVDVVGTGTDVLELPSTAPVFFTRNLSITALGSEVDPAAQLGSAGKDKPFGKDAFVFINRDGSGEVLTKRDLRKDAFNNKFNQRTTVDGQSTWLTGFEVLRPGSQY